MDVKKILIADDDPPLRGHVAQVAQTQAERALHQAIDVEPPR